MFPSGPTAIPRAAPVRPLYLVTSPEGVTRPNLVVSVVSVNQLLPSGPSTSVFGLAGSVGAKNASVLPSSRAEAPAGRARTNNASRAATMPNRMRSLVDVAGIDLADGVFAVPLTCSLLVP